MTLYLVGLLVIVALVGREAWLDRSPRLALAWWAHRRSDSERQAHQMRVRVKKAGIS